MDTQNPMDAHPSNGTNGTAKPLALVPDDYTMAHDAILAATTTQCTARSKQSGVQCKRRPIPGGQVCVMHGGKAPQVQAKALDNLRLARDSALEALNATLTEMGDQMDPRALLDIVVKLTDKVELLEGRATERTENNSRLEVESRVVEIRASIEGKLEQMAERLERGEKMLNG